MSETGDRPQPGWVRSVLFDRVGRVRAGYRAVLGVVGTLVAAVVVAAVVEPLPAPFGDAAHQVGTLAVVLGLAWLFHRGLDDRSIVDYGLAVDRHWVRHALAGFALAAGVTAGAALALVAVGVTTVTATASAGAASSPFPEPVTVALVAPVFVASMFAMLWEVLGFYGLGMRNTADSVAGLFGEYTGLATAAVVVSALFGALHYAILGGSTLGGAWYFLVGIAIALAYVVTGSLALPTGLRAGAPVGYAVLVGYSPSPGPKVVAIDLSRDALFAGQSGAVLVASAALLCCLVVGWVRLTAGSLDVRVATRR